jgi:hypothetical protein
MMRWITLGFVLVAGCGDDVAPGDLGSMDLSMDLSTGGDLANAPDLAVENDDPALAIVTRADNYALIDAYSSGLSTPMYSVTADFVTQGVESFTKQSLGPCALYHAVPAGDAGYVMTDPSQTGTIQLMGGAMPVTVFGSDMGQPGAMGNTNLWSGGESLTFSGMGGQPGTWSTVLTAPAKVTITAPTRTVSQSTVPITKTQDLTVTWTGGTFGFVTFDFYDTSFVTDDFAICTVLASAGTFTIPAATLMQLPNGLSISVQSERQLTAGPFQIEVRARTEAVDNQGTSFNGTLM